ncbi:MAG: PrgI family protein [Candidatus Curtissbacteria bacterium]|nr:PrgI family protein [Candidatus Curtissbacteria bacterium]
MEQHPVPQHIASFQFKLFGNLTIRQFITLAIPMSVAVLTFFSPLPAVVRLPLALVIGLFALFSALIPIQGRPLDKWLVDFIKAVTSPTQRVWVKETRVPEYLNVVTSLVSNQDLNQEPVTAQGRERLDAYLRTLPQQQSSPLDTKEQIALQRLGLSPQIPTQETLTGKLPPVISWPTKPREEGQFLAPESLPQLGEATSVHAAPTSSPKIAHFAKPYAIPGLEKRLKQQEPPHQTVNIAPPNVKTRLASEANFTIENVISIKPPGENTRLIHGIGKTRTRKLHFAPPEGFDLSKLPILGERRFEISEELKKRFGGEEGSQETTVAPVENTPAAPQETMQSIVPPTPPVQNPIANPIGSTPNVVSGFIKNNDGAPIENVILIVKDRDGVPVRALKTNKNGQFLSTTPLRNGAYTVEIESQTQQTPHTLQIDLNGQIVNPMEIKLNNDS